MEPRKFQESGEILHNENYRGSYYCITVRAPTIAPHVRPGQFAHLRIPHSPQLLLRRPFSIYDADVKEGTISIIYKVIGQGTKALSMERRGAELNLLGPLGTPFPLPDTDTQAIIVAGGYGCASTYLIAKLAPTPGRCCLGARTHADILIEDRFRETGFHVRCATNDGSMGQRGLVTDLLLTELERSDRNPMIYACGPNAMLEAVASLTLQRGLDSYLSFDIPMCCGVGACFTCVLKVKANNAQGWEYLRSCRYGPVFKASSIYWGDGEKK